MKEDKSENKAKDCSICEYCEIYYDWDDEIGDEYPVYICQKGNDTSLDYECSDFQKYKPQKYVEKNTKCDKCGYFEECKENLIECTIELDTYRHYIPGIGHVCKVDTPKPMTKQEFIQLYKQMPNKTNISIGELLERAIIDGLVEVKENENTI